MEEENLPLFSLILAVKEHPHLTSLTLDSCKLQKDSNFEIIIVHKGIAEREMKLYKSGYSNITHIQFSKAQTKASMLNEGALFARGEYLLFFFSGDYFLFKDSLNCLQKVIIDEQFPDLVCSSFLLRDGSKPPEVSIREFGYEMLSKGKITSRLSGCVFKRKMFEQLHGFNPAYDHREGLDLLCRIYLSHKYRSSFLPKVIVDYEYIKKSPHEILFYGWETTAVLFHNFGLKKALGWFIFKDQMKMIRLWLKSIRYFFRRK